MSPIAHEEHLADQALTSTLEALESMPSFLEVSFGALPAPEAVRPARDGGFSPVEHCWHLADLEREGFAERLRRLLVEQSPFLPDFDGQRVAQERQYTSLSLAAGLQAFREARAATLEYMRAIDPHAWPRKGTQEAVGPVTMRDVPRQMAEHDASHRKEIERWLQEQRP
jgi:DinB family protein